MARALCLLMCVAVMACPDEVYAQSIELHYLPAGKRLKVDGVDYIAYDLETFKRLALLDAQHHDLQRRYALLEEALTLRDVQVQELKNTVELTYARLDRVLENPPVVVTQKVKVVETRSLWHPEHLAIEAVMLVVIGGLIYALAQ